MVERYYTIPASQRHDVVYLYNSPKQWEIFPNFDIGTGLGIGTGSHSGTNFLMVQGSWAKHR
jgi:hypothetical protein